MTEMQESMQSSVDSLKRLLLISLVMMAIMLTFTYLWSHPSATEKIFKEICQNLAPGEMAPIASDSPPEEQTFTTVTSEL